MVMRAIHGKRSKTDACKAIQTNIGRSPILYGLNLLDYILTIRLIYFLGFGAEAEANWLISVGFRSFPLGVMLYKLLAVYSALLVYHAFIIALTLGFIV